MDIGTWTPILAKFPPSPGDLADGGPQQLETPFTYVGNGGGGVSGGKELPSWLRVIALKKTLIFCVNGAHRSGNRACMIMCATVPDLAPASAMRYLTAMRSMSRAKERKCRREDMADLSAWFELGGLWTSRAPFLTATPHPAPPLQLSLFSP